MRVFLLVAFAALVLGGECRAALDSELDKPYQLTVVLHVGDSRLLTDVFRERIERGLQDYLQASFGSLARVRVVHEHPRLAEVLASGLQRGLDGWKERSDTKTHFVLIDYVGAHYVIQTRQHDGLTGQPSPVVRTERTRDRAFVERAAALLIERDFGVVGSFDRWPIRRGEQRDPPVPMTLQLKGGGLGANLSRWIKRGEVFAVVQTPADGRTPGQPIDFALLRVVDPPNENGACNCELSWRYGAPAEASNFGGYRCLHLATATYPVRLKITQRNAKGGAAPLTAPRFVEVRRNGFTGENDSRLRGTTDPSGSFDTGKLGERGLFDRMAFVSLFNGPNLQARVPVALVADQTVTIAVDRDDTESGNPYAFRLAAWKRDVADAYQIQQAIFRDLEELSKKATDVKGRKDTVEQARDGLKRTREDHTRLTAERTELTNDKRATAADKKALDPRAATAENRLLASLKDGEGVLQNFIKKQSDILAVETDPKRIAALDKYERGRLREREAEYFQALDLYEKALKDYDIASVRAHFDRLKKQLEAKSPAHREAQKFIFDVWPTLNTETLHKRLAEGERGCDRCIEAGDALTLGRLLKGTEAHLTRLIKEAEALKPDVNVDDERPAQIIRELKDGLDKLLTKNAAALDKLAKPAPTEE